MKQKIDNIITKTLILLFVSWFLMQTFSSCKKVVDPPFACEPCKPVENIVYVNLDSSGVQYVQDNFEITSLTIKRFEGLNITISTDAYMLPDSIKYSLAIKKTLTKQLNFNNNAISIYIARNIGEKFFGLKVNDKPGNYMYEGLNPIVGNPVWLESDLVIMRQKLK